MTKRFTRRVAAMQAASNRVGGGETPTELVAAPLGGGWVRLEGRGRGWIDFFGSESGEVVSSKRFASSLSRPRDYPKDLPFLASEQVSLLELPAKGRRILLWTPSGATSTVLARVRAEILDLGWAPRRERRRLFGLLGVSAEFELGPAQLVVHTVRIPTRPDRVRLVVDEPLRATPATDYGAG